MKRFCFCCCVSSSCREIETILFRMSQGGNDSWNMLSYLYLTSPFNMTMWLCILFISALRTTDSGNHNVRWTKQWSQSHFGKMLN